MTRPARSPGAGTGPAAARLAPLLAALALSACQGSDPQPLEQVWLDRFAGPASLVDGGGAASTVGYTSADALSPPTLRLVRHDAASPDEVAHLGDVSFTGGGRITRLRVTDEAVALVVGGAVWVVDPTSPALPAEQVPVPAAAVDLAVGGRWVAAAVDHGLFLVDRDAPLTTYLHAASSTPTALLATGGGFLAFTATGYLVADTSGATPAFQEVSDPALGGVRAAAGAGGAAAVVAGPGAALDRSRVLRLDLSDPAAPVVAGSLEVPGAWAAFAWDGGTTSVVAVHGAGDDARPDSFHQGYLVREAAGGFEATGLPLALWSLSAQPLSAHADRLFAVGAAGVALLRIR